MGFFDFLDDVFDKVGEFFEDVGDFFSDLFTPELPDIPEQQRRITGALLNKESTVAPLPVIYGRRKVGGIRVFKAVTGSNNEKLYIVLAIAEGEIDSYEQILIDDVDVTDARFNGLVTINEYLGTDGQAADTMLINAGIGWTADHKGSGVAYLAMEFIYNQDRLFKEPVVTAIVKGKKVLDTRTSSTAYSDNPATCLYDYLTNARYGKGMATAQLKTAAIDAMANDADTLVTPFSGASTQKKFLCNAIMATDQKILANVREILAGMIGMIPYSEGLYAPFIEGTGSSTFSITEDHFVGGFSWSGANKQSRRNRVTATFADPEQNWQQNQIEYPDANSALYTTVLAEDNGLPLETKVSLPTITNIHTARHIAEVAYAKSRSPGRLQFVGTPELMALSVGDIVDVTHASLGFAAKLFRVMPLSISPGLTVNVTLVEHNDAFYSYTEKSDIASAPGTTLPDPLTVGVPGVPVVVEILYETTGSSALKTRADVSWAAAADAFVEYYQLEYKLSSGSDWTVHPPTEIVSVSIFDMVPGIYDFRVKAVNQLGVAGAYATNLSQEISGLSAPPSTPAGLTISSVGGLAVLRWTQAPDPDVQKGGTVRFRHSTAQSGATWQTSVSIGEALPGIATESVLPLKSGTYLMKFIDASGIASLVAASVPTKGANVIAFSSLTSLQEDAVFSGIHTNTIFDAVDSKLKLAGQGLFDDVTDVDLLLDWDFGNGVALSGTYDFAAGFDLGSVKTVKLETTVAVTVTAALDNIDSRTDNIDTWEDFDGNTSGVGDLVVWVRETDDDPDASPTWSAWNRLDAAEYTARGFDFQARLSTEDPTYNIHVEQLRVAATEVV